MSINKKEGIELLSSYGLPTVQVIDIQSVLNGTEEIVDGLTIRLSPKGNHTRNVMLPSIYNCRDKEKIRDFVKMYSNRYNVFMHKTIDAERIGSVSKINGSYDSLIILEMFKSFNDREKEIIHNRMTIPILGGRYLISGLKLMKSNQEDYMQFIDVFQKMRKLPFLSFESEFFIKDGKVLFTDFTTEERINEMEL